MTSIYLIRHATYDETANGVELENPGLSAEGIRQAERLRDWLARTHDIAADALIASSLRRAVETAETLAPALGLPVILEEELEEWRGDNGSLSQEEFNARWQRLTEAQKPYYRWVPGGESWLEFAARVHIALHRIEQEHDGKTVVIVTHGGVTQAAFGYFFGLSPVTIPGVAVENTSITQWVRPEKSTRWTLKRYNDTRHLESPS
jgi:2,3-bisphosphoglycerate-dependent phosphoglycerate mutase